MAFATRFFRFYNAKLYRSDHGLPVYRHAVVAALSGAKLPTGTEALGKPGMPDGAVSRITELAFEVTDFDRVLAALTPADLHTRRTIQANDVTVLEAIYHVVEHFSMHTGQIILLAKADQADRVRFYDMVDGHPRLNTEFHGRTPRPPH